MKRRRWIVPLTVSLAVCLTVGIYALLSDQRAEDTVRYCDRINALIKDREFFTAKVTPNGIVLYGKTFEELETVPFEDYDPWIDIMGIRKSEGTLHFILLGSVDDEWGLLFVNDETAKVNSIMNGIYSLERAGGNCFYYDTRQ